VARRVAAHGRPWISGRIPDHVNPARLQNAFLPGHRYLCDCGVLIHPLGSIQRRHGPHATTFGLALTQGYPALHTR